MRLLLSAIGFGLVLIGAVQIYGVHVHASVDNGQKLIILGLIVIVARWLILGRRP
jgi:uncharacterized membrane protein